MKCPFCSSVDTKVIDSRPTDDFSRIRRRRECIQCGKRFTTYETVETFPVVVIKKDGSRDIFNRDKLLNGLLRACEKRAVDFKTLDAAVDRIEQTIQNSMVREVRSDQIGELAMAELRDIDEVAYIRFASVYRRFKDIDGFLEELEKLKKSR